MENINAPETRSLSVRALSLGVTSTASHTAVSWTQNHWNAGTALLWTFQVGCEQSSTYGEHEQVRHTVNIGQYRSMHVNAIPSFRVALMAIMGMKWYIIWEISYHNLPYDHMANSLMVLLNDSHIGIFSQTIWKGQPWVFPTSSGFLWLHAACVTELAIVKKWVGMELRRESTNTIESIDLYRSL